jgi:hypothetical protein
MKELLKFRRNYFFLFSFPIALLFFFPPLGAAAQPIERKLGNCNPATESDPTNAVIEAFVSANMALDPPFIFLVMGGNGIGATEDWQCMAQYEFRFQGPAPDTCRLPQKRA